MSKDFVKITVQDIELAEEFFENEKHLDEFLCGVIDYYRGKEARLKTKIVKRYFNTYKKTMDYVLEAKERGKKGAEVRIENQRVKEETLEGSLEEALEEAVEDSLSGNNKEVSSNNKEVINNNKSKTYLDLTPEEFLDEIKRLSEEKKVFSVIGINEFYNNWAETTPKGKMKFQTQDTWNTLMRMRKWAANNYSGKSKYDFKGNEFRNLAY